MKRNVILAVVFVLAVIVSSCSLPGEVSNTKADNNLVYAGTKIAENMPVYKNEYPFSQEGEMFDITSEMEANLESQLRDLATAIYGSDAVKNLKIEKTAGHGSNVVSCDIEGVHLANSTRQVIITVGENVAIDDFEKYVSENTIAKEALKFAGIKTAQIYYPVLFGEDFEDFAVVFEKTDDSAKKLFLETCGGVRFMNFGTSLSITIKKNNSPEILDSRATIGYDGMKAKLASDFAPKYEDVYSDIDWENIRAELVYNYDYYTVKNCFVPCYRVHVNAKLDGENTVFSVNVPMVDISDLK